VYGEGAAAIVPEQGLFQWAAGYSWGASASYAMSGLGPEQPF
jgi:hypothetical protein